MRVTSFWLKWGLRFYPPLFFQRIWVRSIAEDFTKVSVKIGKSLLNKNYHNSIFGGTLFAAADPFYPVMLHQIIAARGYNIVVWSKSAHIQFLKPAATTMHFDLEVTQQDITEAEYVLSTAGKYAKVFDISMYNKSGEVCVIVGIEVYIRNANLVESSNA